MGGGPMGMGGPGFRVHQFGGNRPRRRPAGARGANGEEQPSASDAFRNLLPLLLLFLVPLLSSLFSGSGSTPSYPRFSFDNPIPGLSHEHTTPRFKTRYFTNPVDVTTYGTKEWRRMDSYVEGVLYERLQRECEFAQRQTQRLVQEAQGWFSVDEEKMAQARAVDNASCHRLRGLPQPQSWPF